MRVIINADDFGYSDDVNREIYALSSAGKITSLSLMANSPAFQNAVSLLQDIKNISVGVHLNATSFFPLKPSPFFEKSGIVDESGRFNKMLFQAYPDYRLINAITEEWMAQVKKITECDIEISHLDSHHHVHTIPWLFVALKKVQMHFRIRRVRSTVNPHDCTQQSRHRLSAKKLWRFAVRNYYKTATTDMFMSAKIFLEQAEKIRKSNETFELMCHPGHDWAKAETELLWSEWIKDLPYSIELISYDNLHLG